MNFTGGVGKLLHWIGYFLVFGFTATCTYMLFASITPSDLWWIPILALGFIEYGALKWKSYHKQVAEGVMQHVISLAMLFVCIIAIAGTTGLEVTKWFAGSGYLQTTPWIITLTVYYLVATIVLNVLVYMTIDLIHPDHVAKLKGLGGTPQQPERRIVEADFSQQEAVSAPSRTVAQLAAPQQTAQIAQPVEQTYTKEQVDRLMRESAARAWDEGNASARAQLPASPLAQPALNTKKVDTQAGQTNGTGH